MLLGAIPATSFAQREANASQNLVAGAYNALPVVFDVNANISMFSIPEAPVKWGMDTAWDDQANVLRGTNFIGKDVMKIGRISFQPSDIVGEDLELSSDQKTALQSRLDHIALSGVKDVLLNCDHEALNSSNYYGKPINWYRVIKASVNYAKARGFNVVTIAPFNEPDYGPWGEGTQAHFKEIAKLIYEDSDLAGIRVCAGNTLNCDEALSWYNYMKPYVSEGNTHQLAGSFDTYANFWQTVRNNGHVATADELHNTMEAFVGIHYGMQQGIWWGYDAACRGEFCKASYYGKEIGYNENRSAWTAATVYKRENGRIDAFLGGSERQANTSSYDIVSLDRPVYYDTYGPVYSYSMEIPGGTGYQIGQTNAERMINITYGEDVPIEPLDTNTVYTIMNMNSKKAIGYYNSSSESGTQLVQKEYNASVADAHQRWRIIFVGERIGGDFGYYKIRSNRSATKKHVIDIKDWSLSQGGMAIAFDGDGGTNEQFFFEYAGEGSYYIRSRHSGLYLEVAGRSLSNNANIQQGTYTGGDYQKWKLIPYKSPMESSVSVAPTDLKAENMPAAVKLTWTASVSSDAVAYEILRSKNTDEWDVIGRMISGTEFIDNDVTPDVTYTYKVKTINKARNRSAASATVEGKTTSAKSMVEYLQFEENSFDETDNINDGVTSGDITYSTTQVKKGTASIRLNGSNAYVKLPASVADRKVMTIATWAYINSQTSWMRVFDFGNNTNQYMFFTPNNGKEARFVMKNNGNEQILSADKLSTGWHHISVAISGDNVALYIDGEMKASSSTITIRPSDIRPRLNYIGRSQFSADPLFYGYIDDFRIYNYALSSEDVKKLYNGEEPTGIVKKSLRDKDEYKSSVIYDLSGRRLNSAKKGINIINGKVVAF